MTAGSPKRPQDVAPVLALGLGNLLLGDDGIGLRLVEKLAEENGFGDAVEFVDGGTQGLALLGCLADREAVRCWMRSDWEGNPAPFMCCGALRWSRYGRGGLPPRMKETHWSCSQPRVYWGWDGMRLPWSV